MPVLTGWVHSHAWVPPTDVDVDVAARAAVVGPQHPDQLPGVGRNRQPLVPIEDFAFRIVRDDGQVGPG